MNWKSLTVLAWALLAATPAPAGTPEPTAWQVRDGSRLVIVEGDRAYAAGVALKVRQLQATAGALLHWPETFHPPQALVFLLKEDTVRRHFVQPTLSSAIHIGPYTPVGATIDTPTLSLVVAPRGSERAVEFTPLFNLYGEILVAHSPDVRDWPPCVRIGLAAMVTSAKVTDRNHLLVDGPTASSYETLRPAEFLDPSAPAPEHQDEADRRGYGCHLLAFWYATSPPEERAAFEQMFTRLGAWAPFGDSIPATLGGSPQEFTDRFRIDASQRRRNPAKYRIKAELPGLEQDPPAPEPITSERLESLLGQACTKLARCPGNATPTP